MRTASQDSASAEAGSPCRLAPAALAGALFLALTLSGPANADPVEVDGSKIPGFADVVAAVTPAVVSVRVQAGPARSSGSNAASGLPHSFSRTPLNSLLSSFSGRQAPNASGNIRPVSQGSGFFISGDGYVVTDNDVAAGGDSFQIILNDGTAFSARLVGQDPRTDIAVLKVDAPKRTFTYLGFADDGNVRIGDWIVTVGNPNGLGGTVSAGIVSGRGRDVGAAPFDDFIQFNAPVTGGDAGEPAFDLSGQVVGMNAALFSPGGSGMGVAFAIPARVVERVAKELIRDGSVRRGWLGVALQTVTPDIADSVGLPNAGGALVANVASDAPASQAGIAAGTVVTSVDGKPVQDPRDLARAVSSRKPGAAVKLGLWKGGKAETVTVTLGSLPQPDRSVARNAGRAVPKINSNSPLARFGLTVAPADNARGVVITDVQPASPADRRDLRPGDLVVSVNGSPVKSAQSVLDAIAAAAKEKRRAVLFRIKDGTSSHFVALPIDTG